MTKDRRILEKRLPNDLAITLKTLEPYRTEITGIAVESTFNWYWLVDGLAEAGYSVKLVNTSKVRQYEGLKYTDDRYDAFWLAQQMRLGILPTAAFIRKSSALCAICYASGAAWCVSARPCAIESKYAVATHRDSSAEQSHLGREGSGVPELSDKNVMLGVQAHRATIKVLNQQIETIEATILKHLKPISEYRMLLLSVPGIGPVIAWTIVLEAGDLRRFADVGHFASYCRCVDSKRISNEKKKGKNNTKNGNSYLAWAFFEAAHFRSSIYPRPSASMRERLHSAIPSSP